MGWRLRDMIVPVHEASRRDPRRLAIISAWPKDHFGLVDSVLAVAGDGTSSGFVVGGVFGGSTGLIPGSVLGAVVGAGDAGVGVTGLIGSVVAGCVVEGVGVLVGGSPGRAKSGILKSGALP